MCVPYIWIWQCLCELSCTRSIFPGSYHSVISRRDRGSEQGNSWRCDLVERGPGNFISIAKLPQYRPTSDQRSSRLHGCIAGMGEWESGPHYSLACEISWAIGAALGHGRWGKILHSRRKETFDTKCCLYHLFLCIAHQAPLIAWSSSLMFWDKSWKGYLYLFAHPLVL